MALKSRFVVTFKMTVDVENREKVSRFMDMTHLNLVRQARMEFGFGNASGFEASSSLIGMTPVKKEDPNG